MPTSQFTVCVSEVELLVKLALPLYVAVMVCLPGVSFEVVNFATPPLTDTVCGVTVAVKVTG